MKIIAAVIIVAVVVVLAIALKPRQAEAAMLQPGQVAPPFSTEEVTAQGVTPISLADLRGRTIVLYFYPKDFTPGCTTEACAFRDGYTRFERAGIVLLGCSVDSADAHTKFIQKYNLPFPLLLDPGKKIAKEYGAANGIPILGLDRRITYVIDGDGRIVKAYPDVDPSQHADQILKDLHALGLDKPLATPSPTPAASAAGSRSAD